MSDYNDLLIEIGTEELPPKSLQQLASSLAENIEQGLTKADLPFERIEYFASPRRIGVWVKKVAETQSERTIERLGPTTSIAYDKDGNPTPAALGFAKSCQVELSDLTIKETPKGNCLVFNQVLPGESIFQLAPLFLKNAVNQLPIPKPMIWGNHLASFIRPVHWLLVMFGNQIVPCQLFDLESDNKTYGHRFHHPSPITINHPSEFGTLLKKKGYVISDYHARKENIRRQITELGNSKGKIIIDEDLLDEVTGLVEWPVALMGTFDHRFLKVPQEALISAMKLHQKSFPIVNNDGNLLPFFITVANIESKEPEEVIIGNERVMHARLSDAEFFYHADLKQGIEKGLNRLKTIVFQNKLGTLYDKASRIANLAGYLADQLHCDKRQALRGGWLCKADLTSEMVGEFPELQGIMGSYYAIEDKESPEVALAIKEHYLPRFAGDSLPKTPISSCVALADKLDTLVGIFGINQSPTGEKDPFGLRRMAVGVLRILIENELPLDLKDLLNEAANGFVQLENKNVISDALSFIMDRLRSWYLEQGITPDVYAAVNARYPTSPFDFDKRIKAIQFFQELPESAALSAANKRVSNILKQAVLPPHTHYNYALIELPAEKNLATVIEHEAKRVEQLCAQFDYKAALKILANLRSAIDQFFDEVMVMTEDEKLRHNRLVLLNNLRQLFLQIADISLLQTP